MAKVADEVTQLQNICGIGAARCQAALDANGGDVGLAMRTLIARGEVTADLLNPEHATDEHYALAQAKKLLAKQEAFSPDRRKLLGISDAEMDRGLTEADDPEFAREFMPDIKRNDDLRDMIGLGIVHVLSIAKDGHAYIGFEMGCTWDEEHGVGVMTHMGRVVGVGQGDMGFDSSAAENDGGKAINA